MTTLATGARGSHDAANLSVAEKLRDGRQVEIRALRPADEAGLKAAIAGASSESLRRRFFSLKREFSEKEVAYFMNVDFVTHVALVAVADGVIIGGCRYIVVRPGVAEVAFAVVDEYQGQGLGGAMLRRLISVARAAELTELVATVLPENRPMLAVFERCGLRVRTWREDGAVAIGLQLSDNPDTGSSARYRSS